VPITPDNRGNAVAIPRYKIKGVEGIRLKRFKGAQLTAKESEDGTLELDVTLAFGNDSWDVTFDTVVQVDSLPASLVIAKETTTEWLTKLAQHIASKAKALELEENVEYDTKLRRNRMFIDIVLDMGTYDFGAAIPTENFLIHL